MLLTKIARQFQTIVISIAAVRYGTSRSQNVVVLSKVRRVWNSMLRSSRSSMLSLSLFVTMTAIFAGVFLISFGRLEVPRENPQRHADVPRIYRPAPAPHAPNPERLSPGDFTIVMGSVEAIGRVIDGDTLVAGPKRIRLDGIDAPEIDQSCHQGAERVECGSLAAENLTTFLSGHRVTCRSDAVDRFQRQLATCFLRNGTDVNRHMVASGWAIASRRYSNAYVADEAYARTRRLGIWAGSFVQPEDWRAGAR